MTMNCLATPTQRTGEPEAPGRASLGLNRGKRRAYSEPARLRGQFTGRKRPRDSDRAQPENQNKTQKHRGENAKNHCEIAITINNPFNCTEMLEKSGRSLSPCVEVNGDEVEAYLLEAGVLHLTDAPANWACDAHHHE